MNLLTRLTTFPGRLAYRWAEDEFDELRKLRNKMDREGVPAVARSIEVGMVEQMIQLSMMAHRLRDKGVTPIDYATSNLEMLWGAVIASGVLLWVLLWIAS
jgi:hypothetical protein